MLFKNNTDASGAVNQHLQYLPPYSYRDGEDYIYQRNSSWAVPYTFSGKEKDAETGYSYFGARYYNSDLSIWLSVDAYSSYYPQISPYLYVAGNPSNLIDFNGNFIVDEEFKKKYPHFYSYLTNQLLVDFENSVNLKKQLMELGEFETWDELKTILTSGTTTDGGSGPNLSAALQPGEFPIYTGGSVDINTGNVELSSILLDYFEKAFSGDNSIDRKYALMYVYVTLLHETIHYGDISHGDNRNGKMIPEKNCRGEENSATSEIGDIFEMRVWGYNIGSANAKGSQDLLNQYSSSTTRVINLFKMVPPNSTQFSKKDLPTTSERRHPPMYDPH